MSSSKATYRKPDIQYWSAADLDAIEATMSGGGGSYPATGSVYLLNNVDGLSSVGDTGILGHAAIMIQKPYSSLFSLYNFGPSDNKSPFCEGTIGVFADGDMSWTAFRSKCRSGGVAVENGNTSWTEGFDRHIRIDVSQSACALMRRFAINKISNPSYYVAVSYNCLSFVIDVLSYGGITVYGSSGNDLSASLIPNSFFNDASSCSLGSFHAVQYI
jgi:hypothetical protein